MTKDKFKLQPAVKKETLRILIYTAIGVVLMYLGFLVAGYLFSDVIELPFTYRIILGGLGGGVIAVFDFFLMGLSVQSVAAEPDDKVARNIMKASYSRRMLLKILWLVVAIAAPCFQLVASILPLLFPTLGIKIKGIIDVKKSLRQEVEQKQDEH